MPVGVQERRSSKSRKKKPDLASAAQPPRCEIFDYR
jgi:hypothetical protein